MRPQDKPCYLSMLCCKSHDTQISFVGLNLKAYTTCILLGRYIYSPGEMIAIGSVAMNINEHPRKSPHTQL